MAVPTVFVSSTFYDLRHIRESVKRFVETLGYNAVLSEDGAVFYDPEVTAAQACLAEVPNAQLFVLIIGGRYGSIRPETGQSITNSEYQEAVRQRVPVFALVEEGTLNDYRVYKANAGNPNIVEQLVFPHADDVRIFSFIDEVVTRASNNALQPFRTAAELESYLQLQWAGMMHAFLTRAADQQRVADSLELLGQVNRRVELLAQQILSTVGSPLDKVTVNALRHMLTSQAVSDMRYWKLTPTPADIARYETFERCVSALGGTITVLPPGSDHVLASGGEIAAYRLEQTQAEYTRLRDAILAGLREFNVGLEDFLQYDLAEAAPVGSGQPKHVPGLASPTTQRQQSTGASPVAGPPAKRVATGARTRKKV